MCFYTEMFFTYNVFFGYKGNTFIPNHQKNASNNYFFKENDYLCTQNRHKDSQNKKKYAL